MEHADLKFHRCFGEEKEFGVRIYPTDSPRRTSPRIKWGHLLRLIALLAAAFYCLHRYGAATPGVQAQKWGGLFVIVALVAAFTFISGMPGRSRTRRRR